MKEIIKKINYKNNIKFILKSQRLWCIVFIFVFAQFICDFVSNTFRVYGALISLNGNIIRYYGAITGIIFFIFGPLWGNLYDKMEFKNLIKILLSISFLEGIILIFFINNHIIYFICICVNNILSVGFENITLPYIIYVFGDDYSIEVSGVLGIINKIFNSISILISFYIDNKFHTKEGLSNSYKIIFFFGLFLCAFAFRLGSKEPNYKFYYPYSSSNNNNENIQKAEVPIS